MSDPVTSPQVLIAKVRDEIRAEGHYGWGNALDDALAAFSAARPQEQEDAMQALTEALDERPESLVAGIRLLELTLDAEHERAESLSAERLHQQWTCFHCGETFTTPGGASDHFGATPEAQTGCLIDRVALEEGGKPERGRGLLMALRKVEDEIARLHRLKGYTEHRYGCQMRSSTAEYERTGKMPDCTCGLADALSVDRLRGEGPQRCEGRYPVPQTAPKREEPFEVTYRCALPVGHLGPHGGGEAPVLRGSISPQEEEQKEDQARR